MATSDRGFASMTTEERKRIASMGGRAAHAQGKAHRFTTEEARAAGASRNGLEVVDFGNGFQIRVYQYRSGWFWKRLPRNKGQKPDGGPFGERDQAVGNAIEVFAGYPIQK